MTDEQLMAIYTEGNNISTVAAVRAVFEAGRNHDKRMAALEKGQVYVPTEEQIADVRADAVKAAKKEGLSAKKQQVVADEAEAELKTR